MSATQYDGAFQHPLADELVTLTLSADQWDLGVAGGGPGEQPRNTAKYSTVSVSTVTVKYSK